VVNDAQNENGFFKLTAVRTKAARHLKKDTAKPMVAKLPSLSDQGAARQTNLAGGGEAVSVEEGQEAGSNLPGKDSCSLISNRGDSTQGRN